MSKLEKDLLVKMMESFQMYFRESWKEFIAQGGQPQTHNKFYEFMKEKCSSDLTKMTGANIRELNNKI